MNLARCQGDLVNRPQARLWRPLTAAALLAAAIALIPAPSASAATAVTLYASSTGTGSMCTQASPCSLAGAQAAVRSLSPATSGADVTVLVQDGTYRLAATWSFGVADSGSAGHPVVWQAAP